MLEGELARPLDLTAKPEGAPFSRFLRGRGF